MLLGILDVWRGDAGVNWGVGRGGQAGVMMGLQPYRQAYVCPITLMKSSHCWLRLWLRLRLRLQLCKLRVFSFGVGSCTLTSTGFVWTCASLVSILA